VTIPIDIVAPASAGTYNFQWRLVHGTTWFGATTPNVAVNVGAAGAPVAGMQFIHVDHLNTPREIYDASSQLRWRWDQAEPFGVNVPDENPSSLGAFEFALRFPGQYFDRETNLHYNYFRDYSSGEGRYIQSDPIGLRGGINTYGYVNGSPAAFTDSTGQGGLSALGGVGLVVLAGGLAQGTASALNGGSFASGFATGALTGAVVGLAVISGGSAITVPGLIIQTTGGRVVGGYVGGLLMEIGIHSFEVSHVIGTAHGSEVGVGSNRQSCP
jgi:RHS repeat-associated protein